MTSCDEGGRLGRTAGPGRARATLRDGRGDSRLSPIVGYPRCGLPGQTHKRRLIFAFPPAESRDPRPVGRPPGPLAPRAPSVLARWRRDLTPETRRSSPGSARAERRPVGVVRAESRETHFCPRGSLTPAEWTMRTSPSHSVPPSAQPLSEHNLSVSFCRSDRLLILTRTAAGAAPRPCAVSGGQGASAARLIVILAPPGLAGAALRGENRE